MRVTTAARESVQRRLRSNPRAGRFLEQGVRNGSGSFSEGQPLEFAGNSLRLTPKSDMAAALTRTGVEVVRQNKVVGAVNLIDRLDGNDFNGTYLTGSKVQPVAFSGDLSRLYVAGKGVVYVIDLLSYRLIDTIAVTAGRNIASLASVGSLLLIGEGDRYGVSGGYRLLAMDINPGSATYNRAVSLQGTGIEKAPAGISGMVVGPDGRTLIVATPNTPSSVSLATKDSKPGDVLVLDLDTLDLKTGKIAAPVKAQLPADGLSGKSPQVISATDDADRYLVSHVSDYDKGLATLIITRDPNGKVTSAKLTAISLIQPTGQLKVDRLNIQRAQSVVLVEHDGVEYAIVADDNYNFNDPYYRAMFEAPNFLYTPFGPPIAYGGSASARKVAVGGKLGIVRDPFGEAKFIGATLPLDGYGIVNLAVSEDGQVLIGQLNGKYGSVNSNVQQPHQSHAWNVKALIDAALAQPTQDRLRKHITLPELAEQLIPTPASAPAGTFFDPTFVSGFVVGNLGDVIGVDLKEMAAKSLLFKEKVLADYESVMTLAELELRSAGSSGQTKADLVRTRMASLKDFTLQRKDLDYFADVDGSSQPKFKLVTTGSGDKLKPVSRIGVNSTVDASFKDTGILFFVPQLSDLDELALRSGDVLEWRWTDFLFGCEDTSKPQDTQVEGLADIVAHDFASTTNVFFGDRPLESPGYSAFSLADEVKVGSKNVLDVYRVEQRLKYLGYPAMGIGNPNVNNNALQDFKVDGKFAEKEQAALKLFEKVVRYDQSANNSKFNNDRNGADGKIDFQNGAPDTQGAATLTWFNAYNAPHWMQFFQSTGNTSASGAKFKSSSGKLPGWENKQIGTTVGNVEVFGTSWMFDLMVAKQFASGVAQPASRFSGSVDANYGFTPKWNLQNVDGQHWTHDLGMAFDLGISNYTDGVTQGNEKEPLTRSKEKLQQTFFSNGASYYSGIPDKVAYEASQWNYDNAVYLASLLPSVSTSNDQASALRDFLSLYTVTRSDTVVGNGSWEELPIRNGEAVRAALFGSGLDDGDLISGVHIGGTVAASNNPYRNINDILGRLGVASSAVEPHKHHFHLYLLPPAPLSITKTLLAGGTAPQATPLDVQNAGISTLFDAVQLFVTGDELMFTVDVPYVPAQDAPLVLAQAAATTSNPPPADYLMKHCTETEHTTNLNSAVRSVNPAGAVRNYVQELRNRAIDITEFKPTLLQGPRHGTLNYEVGNDGSMFYSYDPEAEFLGKDRAVFMVEYQGKHFRVVVDIQVLEVIDIHESSCPERDKVIKLRKPSRGDAGVSIPDLPAVTLRLADLSGISLGEATGTTITLDLTAAGHGWFIDATPSDNSEFLPTSDPNEWIAKQGSDADGKIDLLTVLLHEYGHALGLEHSTDAHDVMATTLQPGVRRTLSVDEQLMLMNLAGIFVTPDSPSEPYRPTDPGVPLPFTRINGTALYSRIRRGDGTGLDHDPQYEIAANAQLENPQFIPSTGSGQAAGWSTTGDVTFADGAATLAENATTQTRLNQVFVLGQDDRTLAFTVANTAIGDQENGPDDAFEVALIDATTGLSLLGSSGLTHSDAIINFQADGSESDASAVSVVSNADGSRSYVIDLTGIAAGKVVNLAFDLIGFGKGVDASNSSLTIRHLHLGLPQNAPQANDDAVTLVEDTPISIDALANDLNASQPGFAPEIVDGPAHGQVTIDADGRFTYTLATRPAPPSLAELTGLVVRRVE